MRHPAILVTLVLLALAARGDEFRPVLILSSETRDSGPIASSRLRQYLELYFSRALTDTMTLQLDLEGNHDDLSTEVTDLFGTTASDTRSWEVRPAGTLLADFGRVETETTWAARASHYETGAGESSRDDERFLTRASWGATPRLPGGTIHARHSELDDDATQRVLSNDSVDGTLDYSWRGLTAVAGETWQRDTDSQAGYERTTVDSLANLSYNSVLAHGKLSVSAFAGGAATTISDQTSDGSADIPTDIRPARGLWAIDDTPPNSADQPLAALPALVDGRATVITPIDLGPAGASFQAIAFDIGRVSKVDEIWVIVRDEKADPVISPGSITWDVYRSDDGVRWFALTGMATTRFDRARSFYEISFDQVETRWIKVVNFGVAGQPAFVSEGIPRFHTARDDGGETTFDTLTSSAMLTYTPVRSLTVGYAGATYATSQQSGDALESNVDDVFHGLSVRFDPGRRAGYEARYETQETETDLSFQNVRSLIGSIRLTPIPPLTSTFSCTLRDEDSEAGAVEGLTCSANATAQIFPTLDLTAGVSGREQQFDHGGIESYRSYFASSTARLSRSTRLTLTAASNRTTYEDWPGLQRSLPRDDRATAEVVWFNGKALELGVTLTWIESSAFSGLAQRYRFRWSPFGDGTVTLQTNYVHDIDPYTNAESKRLLVAPRWQVNEKTSIEVTYTSVLTTGDVRYETNSLLAALIIGR